MEQYQVKTDKASGIVSDPNQWIVEHADPRYIVDLLKRIVTVSIETTKTRTYRYRTMELPLAVANTLAEDCNTTASGAVNHTVKVDLSEPTATFDASIGSSYFGSVPAAPTCTSTDSLSGPGACTVSSYSTVVGTHTLTATALDLAGRTGTATQTYTVLAWTAKGFYQTVDMAGVFNTVKGRSTGPVKFELFAGSTELIDLRYARMSAKTIPCSTSAMVDDIELVTTGDTTLR
jgi:hypothetical protein